MSVLNVLVSISTLILFLIGVATFMMLWVRASDEDKAKWQKLRKLMGKKVYRFWTYVSSIVLIAQGVWKIVAFLQSSDPVTRVDIVMLLGNVFSLAVFTGVALAVYVYWALQDKVEAN